MIFTQFAQVIYTDGCLNVSLSPPTPIGGWSIEAVVNLRFEGVSGLITKSVASGYGGGASGITILNSGLGQFKVAIGALDGSGAMDPGTYATKVTRTDSGFVTRLVEAWFIRLP